MKKLILFLLSSLFLITTSSWGADATATLTYNMYDANGIYAVARDNISASNNSSGGADVGQDTGFKVRRGYLEFPIPVVSAVASAYLHIYLDTDTSTTDFDINLYLGSWSSMATNEWDQFDGWTSGSAHTGTNLAETFNTSSLVAGYNIIELSAAGRAAILSASNTTIKIAMVSGEDVSRSQPTGDEYVAFESKNAAGKEPFLRITETAASTDGTFSGVKLSGIETSNN